MSDDGGGQRLQIILLKVKPNKNGTVTELLKISKYLKKQGEHYEIIGQCYGRPINLPPKLAVLLCEHKLIEEPAQIIIKTTDELVAKGLTTFQKIRATREKEELHKVKLWITNPEQPKENR
jgi:hypothetical protein